MLAEEWEKPLWGVCKASLWAHNSNHRRRKIPTHPKCDQFRAGHPGAAEPLGGEGQPTPKALPPAGTGRRGVGRGQMKWITSGSGESGDPGWGIIVQETPALSIRGFWRYLRWNVANSQERSFGSFLSHWLERRPEWDRGVVESSPRKHGWESQLKEEKQSPAFIDGVMGQGLRALS